MDLGIKGRGAIVCAASQGLGKGCAEALAGDGVNLVITRMATSTWPGPGCGKGLSRGKGVLNRSHQ